MAVSNQRNSSRLTSSWLHRRQKGQSYYKPSGPFLKLEISFCSFCVLWRNNFTILGFFIFHFNCLYSPPQFYTRHRRTNFPFFFVICLWGYQSQTRWLQMANLNIKHILNKVLSTWSISLIKQKGHHSKREKKTKTDSDKNGNKKELAQPKEYIYFVSDLVTL